MGMTRRDAHPRESNINMMGMTKRDAHPRESNINMMGMTKRDAHPACATKKGGMDGKD